MKAVVPAWKRNAVQNNWFNEFDQLFDGFFQPQLVDKGFSPALEIKEEDDYILLSLDIPGVEEKDLEVNIENKQLSVSGERFSEEKEDQNGYSFSERKYGKFKRSFTLPEIVDAENIEADYTNGVLKLLLPKKEKAKPKKLDIKVNKGHFFSKLIGDKEKK